MNKKTGYRYLQIEMPDIGATVDFLDDNASVKVYMDRTHNPPTIRIEVTASASETSSTSRYESFEFELPEAEPNGNIEEDEDTTDEDANGGEFIPRDDE